MQAGSALLFSERRTLEQRQFPCIDKAVTVDIVRNAVGNSPELFGCHNQIVVAVKLFGKMPADQRIGTERLVQAKAIRGRHNSNPSTAPLPLHYKR